MTSRELQRIYPDYKPAIDNYLSSFPVKLGAFARAVGISSIRISSMSPGVSGQISKEGDNYIIRINRNEARERQRFTIAHEIAHYLLHRNIIDNSPEGITDNVLYRSGAPERIEYEANRLAADLVMPMSLIEQQLKQFGGLINESAIEQLAKKFDVSKAAMEIRLSTLVEA